MFSGGQGKVCLCLFLPLPWQAYLQERICLFFQLDNLGNPQIVCNKLGLKELTLSLQILGFVLLSPKQGSCSFLEETLSRTGVVDSWGCMTTVSRQSVWCETLK